MHCTIRVYTITQDDVELLRQRIKELESGVDSEGAQQLQEEKRVHTSQRLMSIINNIHDNGYRNLKINWMF